MDFLSENETEVVRNILDPDLFVPDSFETLSMGMGVTMIVGYLKDSSLVQLMLNPGRKYVQGVKFLKPTWDMGNALDWLRENQKNFALESEALEKETKLYSIDAVEVFSIGKWNGQEFKEADLDKMVESFKRTSTTVRPYLKLGHDDEQKLLKKDGLPAAGWVGNIYRKGGKLVADFVDIPKKIYELIEKKAYRKVSIELFKNVEILDDKYEYLISAIALLGAETPGVLNLNDILAQFKINSYDSKYTFTQECEIDFSQNGGDMDPKELATALAETEALKIKLADAQAQAMKFKTDLEATESSADEIKKELEVMKEQFNKTAQDLKKKEIESQVLELEKSSLITPAMKPFVAQLLDAEVQTFSIKEEKEATRFEVLKHLFELAQNSDVNLKESSVEVEGETTKSAFDKIDQEIEEYAKTNKVSYSQAYGAVSQKYEKELTAAE